MQHSIERAHCLQAGRPQPTELIELDSTLRLHIATLRPRAVENIDRLGPGSIDWSREQWSLDLIDDVISQPPGDTTLSRITSIAMLARGCQWLLTHHGASRPRAQADTRPSPRGGRLPTKATR
ncbi:DUF6415 family natural product biosynthesis protein [Streptomyces cinnamoneus]|uniref:DUF6415 family natural product biosynthesis protein n=1 Tax=Streptomyces cinnamoneus TaxID=53446 RepID=UPI0033E2565B